MLGQTNWKRFLLTLFVVPIVITTHAQFSITAMLPAGSIYLRSQLWNLSISNTSNVSADVQLQLEMKDLQTQQTVLSAVSNMFVLAPGVGIVQLQSLEPIEYSGTTTSDQSSNGFLPIGQYQVCYQLLYKGHSNNSLLADDCEQIQVEPLSPPLLLMPENDSIIDTGVPNFMWTAPAPVTMFSNLSYDILISEVYDGQSPTEAIQKNLPVQQVTNLQQPLFTYSLQGSQLEEGKKYAWQIIAKDQQRFGARSEVWLFQVGNKKTPAPLNNATYLLMDDKTNNIGIADSGFLGIKYISNTISSQIPISIKDESGTQLITINREIKQGDNYIDIPLDDERFKSDQNYTVSITDDNGKIHSLVFTIRQIK